MADLECTHEDSETRCQDFRKGSFQLEVAQNASGATHAAAGDIRARESACLGRQKDPQRLAQPRAKRRLVGCTKLARTGRQEPVPASAAARV